MLRDAEAELAKIQAPHTDGLDYLSLKMAVLQEQADWRALVSVAAEFVQRAPEEPGGWVTWAYATRRAHTLAAAEQILLEAETSHPEDATIQFNLGCYACVRGDLVAARARVARAIELDPKFREAAETDPDLEALRSA